MIHSAHPAARIEKDTMGSMPVPASVLYGASTQRAVLNFPVSGRPVPEPVIKAYAILKEACAKVNRQLGRLDESRTKAISLACREILSGLASHPAPAGLPVTPIAYHFPVDIFQTGSGTSTNMNANEVIANLVCLQRGKPIGSSKDPAYIKEGGVHPNDHVNMGQSSNDTFPTAMNIAAALLIQRELIPAVQAMAADLEAKAKAWDTIVKIGRTHLADATPIRLGQEFSGYASQLRHAEARLTLALDSLSEVAIGGTAVGTGINAHEKFGAMVATELTRLIREPSFAFSSPSIPGCLPASMPSSTSAPLSHFTFREAGNHFEAQHARDCFVDVSGHLKTVAVSLSKIANDIRWMGSGPRCGIGELNLPAVQPGSSIMPGKVNPVICESLIMVCCQVMGNDAATTYGGWGGVGSLLDLNVAMPMMAANLLDSITLLSRGCRVFTQNLLIQHDGDAAIGLPPSPGLQPNLGRCAELIEGSLAMCTSLVPVIGYDKSAALAKDAFKQGKTVRQLAYEVVVGTPDNAGKTITKEAIDAYLNPWSMTLPGGEGSGGG